MINILKNCCWLLQLLKCYWLKPHAFTFISNSCLAANVWLPSMNLNIFPASPPCVFAEIDSDGLWDWGTLGNGVSWRHREVRSRPSLWATGWPDAHSTSSEWPQPPQHKQFTSVEWPKGIWDHRPARALRCFQLRKYSQKKNTLKKGR